VTGQEIQYSKNWSFGPTCTKCEAKVNPPNEPFDQSWHDSTFLTNGPLLTASVTFTGSAVYVVCILTGTSSNPNANSDMTFLLDGEEVGSFQQSPNGNPAYLFDSVVFSKNDLSLEQHNITLVSGRLGKVALVLLDRIIYTTEVADDQPSSSQDSSPGSGSEPSTLAGGNTTTVVVVDGNSKSTVVTTATETSDVTQSITETPPPGSSTTSGLTSSSRSRSSLSLSLSSKASSTKSEQQSTHASSSLAAPGASGGANTSQDVGHSRHLVVIALGVLASLLALIGAAFALFWLRKRKCLARLKAAPWFERMSVASNEQQMRMGSSLFVETPGTSTVSIHGETGITIPSFFGGSESIPQTDADSESKPPSYAEDSDTHPNTGVYNHSPILEKH